MLRTGFVVLALPGLLITVLKACRAPRSAAGDDLVTRRAVAGAQEVGAQVASST